MKFFVSFLIIPSIITTVLLGSIVYLQSKELHQIHGMIYSLSRKAYELGCVRAGKEGNYCRLQSKDDLKTVEELLK